MKELYEQILEKYNNGDFVEKNRSDKEVNKDMYSLFAQEFIVFSCMKQNKDDRWKQIMKIVLLPNDIEVPELNIEEIMKFIGSMDKEYTEDSIIHLFKEFIPKVETEETEETPFFEIVETDVEKKLKSTDTEIKEQMFNISKNSIKESLENTEIKQINEGEIKQEKPVKKSKRECKCSNKDGTIICLDPYIMKLIEDVEDKQKYIEYLIMKDYTQKN